MLKIEGIEFGYQERKVLAGVDIEVGEGELVGVVGPNGCGKTTLLRLISGSLKPSKGSVLIGGKDISDITPRDRAHMVAVVPQNPLLPTGYTVSDLVLMGRNAHLKLLQREGTTDFDAADRAIAVTGMVDLADRVADTLSGGERQRAVIAMALAQEAPLLLLDEPTASLDLPHQINVMNLVRELHGKRGRAVVIAMHDLTMAARYCTRMIMLFDCKVGFEGTPAQVLTEENIAMVYGAEVVVLRDPRVDTPVVVGLGVRR